MFLLPRANPGWIRCVSVGKEKKPVCSVGSPGAGPDKTHLKGYAYTETIWNSFGAAQCSLASSMSDKICWTDSYSTYLICNVVSPIMCQYVSHLHQLPLANKTGHTEREVYIYSISPSIPLQNSTWKAGPCQRTGFCCILLFFVVIRGWIFSGVWYEDWGVWDPLFSILWWKGQWPVRISFVQADLVTSLTSTGIRLASAETSACAFLASKPNRYCFLPLKHKNVSDLLLLSVWVPAAGPVAEVRSLFLLLPKREFPSFQL